MPPSSSDLPGSEFTTADLMIQEQVHRHANELAATLAGLRILRARGPRDGRMLDEAIDRVEAQYDLHRLMLAAGSGDLGPELADLCHCLLRSRLGGNGFRIVCRIDRVTIPHDLRRVFVLTAYELVNNAIKHSSRGSGVIRLTCRTTDENHILCVSNCADGGARHSASGRGTAIVSGLADHHGGTLRVRLTRRRAQAMVSFERRIPAASSTDGKEDR